MPFPSVKSRTWLRLGLFVLVVAALATAGRWLAPGSFPTAAEASTVVTGDFGLPELLGFIGLYALAVVALLPGSLLAIAAGVTFGWKLGLVVAVVASNLGALLSFAIARLFGRGLVKLLLQDRIPRLEQGAAELGFEAILALRLLSVVPVLNYASGLSAVRLRDFALASVLGLLPSTLLFVILGSNRDPLSPEFWIVSGLILVLAGLPILARRRARRVRHSAGGAAADLSVVDPDS